MIHVKLYVGNLDYAVEDRDLREIFERAGCDVLEGHVCFDSNGRSRGFGAVRVAKADVDAATKLSDTEYRGRKLLIRPWTESARFTQSHYRKA